MDLSERIRDTLDSLSEQLRITRGGDTDRTARIHEAISALAPELAAFHSISCGLNDASAKGGARLGVYVSGGKHGAIAPIGFMFDQCWLTYFENESVEEDGYTTRCDLAMETEWSANPEEIHRDFLKLVVAKAHLKVLVCRIPAQNSVYFVEEIAAECSRQLACYDLVSDQESYLVSIYHKNQFRHFASKGKAQLHPVLAREDVK